MSPQTCTNCGSELVSGQRFCPACGTPVAAAPTEAVAAAPPKKAPSRGLRLLLVGGGGLVLLACICIAVFVVSSLLSDTAVAPLATPGRDYQATGVAPLATPRRDYEAGEYFIELMGQGWRGRWQTYPDQTFSDFAAEVQVRFETDVESVGGGLVWRLQIPNSAAEYYCFNISSTGGYVLKKRVDGEWQFLIPFTASPHINAGIATNNLKVVAAADLISIYVNDQHLADFTDSSLSEGKIGLWAEAVGGPSTTTRVVFDNLRIYAPTAPSTVLFEDDFDDPESGWAVAEAEASRVGYVSASEAVEASGPVEVVSERELTPDEFFQAVEGDERFAEVYDLASEQGYTEAETGVEAVMSDGSVLAVLPLTSPEGETVAAFRLEGDERSNSLLARLEEEAVILYDREGRAEITEQGVRVFDAGGNVIGDTELQGSSRPPGLSAPQQQGCTGGHWDDFDHCCQRFVASGLGTLAACSAGVATCGLIEAGTLGGGTPACLVALTASGCPFAYHCVFASDFDNPPTVEVKTMPRLEESPESPCLPQCIIVDGQQGVLTIPAWRFQIDIDDDRAPRPQTPRFIEVCAGSGKWVEPVVEDCSGQPTPYYVGAPPPDTREGVDFAACPEGQICPDGETECRWPEAPEPPEPTVPPGPTGPPLIRIWLGGAEAELDEVLVLEDECVELKWEVQGATTVQLDGNTVSATGTRDLCPTEQWTTYNLTAEGPGGTNAIYWVVAK
jgi:hypothetical protein